MGRTDRYRILGITAALVLVMTGCGNAPEKAAESVTESVAVEADDAQVATETLDGEEGGAEPEASEEQETEVTEELSETTEQTTDEPQDVGNVTETVMELLPLHVEGTQLVNEAGVPVQLKGLSTHGLAWFPQYVNQELFAELATDWKCNVVRLAMYSAEYNGYCTGGSKEELKQLIRDGVQYAENAGMYVIVDWHVLGEGDPNLYKEEAKTFFDEMSKEFADKHHVIYEICNEPNGGVSWSSVKAYAQEVIPVIRANDEDAVVIVGTPTWSQDVDQAAADPITEYDNVMYALHFYAATHKEELRNRMVDAIGKGLPVIVSEYGICSADGNGGIDEEQASAWIGLMNDMNVSYVAWNISNKAETSAILTSGCKKMSGFTQEDLSENGRWLYRMMTAGEEDASAVGQGGKTDQEKGKQEQAFKTAQSTTVKKAPESEEKQNVASGTGGDWLTSGALEYRAVVCNSWESDGKMYEQYEVTLRNASSDDITEWKIELSFDRKFEVTDSWNGTYTVEGRKLWIGNASYNGTAAPEEEIKDIGFIVCYEKNNS